MKNLIEHVRELASRKSKAYELLLALEENPQADESCFQSLARVVDRIVFYEITLDSGALLDLSGLVRSEAPDLGSTLAVLTLALAEAEPERASIQTLLEGFAKWLDAVSEIARPHLLGILPNIAIHLKDLDAGGVDALIACFNLCGSSDDCEILAGCIARYQETQGSILLAAAEIASVAIRTDARPMVSELMTAVAPEAIFDSKPARELLPALVRLKTAAASQTAGSAAIAVCVAVARDNHSSALNLARRLEGSLGSMTAGMQLAYLRSFESVIEAGGISLLGYGTTRLPALFQKAGEDRAGEYVAEGVAIAQRYGRVAAEEFFEQRTALSKQDFPAG